MSGTNHNVGFNERKYRKDKAAYKARCEREGVPCMWCLEPINYHPPLPTHPKAFSVEHLIHRSRGGTRDDPANWGPAHFGCNSSRGDRDTPRLHTQRTVLDPKSEEWP